MAKTASLPAGGGKGLAELRSRLWFVFLALLVYRIDAHILVSDFDPLRVLRLWKDKLIEKVASPFYEVDSHNVIPAWTVSDKKEYAAYPLRPKIKRVLDDFLTDIPPLKRHPVDLYLFLFRPGCRQHP